MVQVVKTTKFFGMDVSEINEVYTAEIYGREFIIHPSVVASNGGKFEFPVNGCEIIKIAGSIIVVPGEKVMTFFSAGEESHIEDTYGCGCGCQVIYHTIFDRKKWEERDIGVIIVANKDQKPTIEWIDGEGNRWVSTVDCATGTVEETVPNPNPPPEEEED